jgi:hypothetical protein
MNNGVGYARPTARPNRVVLGSDGIGADMLEEARLAYARLREYDLSETPDTVARWIRAGYTFFPEARHDEVTWSYDQTDQPWRVAFTPGIHAIDITLDTGEQVLRGGVPTRLDVNEVRAKAAEQAARLFARL